MKEWITDHTGSITLITVITLFISFIIVYDFFIWQPPRAPLPEKKGWVEVGGGSGFKSDIAKTARFTVNTDTWKVVWNITRSDLPEYRRFEVDIHGPISDMQEGDLACSFSEEEANLGNSGETVCHKPGTYDLYDLSLGITSWNIKIYELQQQWWSEKWVEVKNIKNTDPLYYDQHFTVTTGTWRIVWSTDAPLAGPVSFTISIYRPGTGKIYGDEFWSKTVDFERDKPYPPTTGEAICHGAGTYDVSVDAFGKWGYTISEWYPNGTATPT